MDARPVILVDFSALFRRAWHVASEVSHAFESTIAGVNRASAQFNDSLVAVCCDGRGNWRKLISKEYKAQREAQPSQMYGEMDRTLDRLRKDGRLIWKFDGFEADDVIATATMCAKTRGHTVRIVSHDKDLLQLLGPSVDFLAIHKNPWEVATAEVVRERYGVETTQLADWLALVGDSSDNVKGCPGVGGKTATALLQKFGDLATISAFSVKEIVPPMTANIQKNIIANWIQIETARKLVSLSVDVPLRFDEIYEERKTEDIEERDHMKEAEADAAKYFGQENDNNDAPKTEATSVKPEVVAEQPEPEKTGSGNPEQDSDSLKQPQSSPAPAETSLVISKQEIIPVVEYSRQLEPRSLREADVYARMMFNSRVYSRYPTSNAMVAAIVRGREMGYGAGAALDMFHVADFNNDGNLRLMLQAHFIIDRVMNDPGIEYFMLVSNDEKHATYEAKVKRNPKPQTFTYTIEDATAAGLVRQTRNGQPNTWMKRPKEQLRKTCGVQFGRIVAPGAAHGLYCIEEMGVDNED